MLNKTMEDIDIETLDFDKYNREVYYTNNLRAEQSFLINAQKNYKNMINKFVKNIKRVIKEENKVEEEKIKRIKKRKY